MESLLKTRIDRIQNKVFDLEKDMIFNSSERYVFEVQEIWSLLQDLKDDVEIDNLEEL